MARNQPAPGGSGKPLIPNEVVQALVQHFDEHDLSNKSVSADVLGRVYEYFLSQFTSGEGKKGGEFYTRRCVVKLLLKTLEPYRGRVYNPC